MNARDARVLLVEDDPEDARQIREALTGPPFAFSVERVERLDDALALLAGDAFEAILLDLSLPDSQGFETFAAVFDAARELPILVLAGSADEDLALKAIRAGAQDHLVKGSPDPQGLARALRYAIERKQNEAALARSNRELASFRRVLEIDAVSDSLKALCALLAPAVSVAADFPHVAIELYDPARQVMRAAATWGIERPAAREREVPVEQSLSGLVALSGSTLVETDARSRARYRDPALLLPGTRTFVAVPMAVDGRVLGTISVASSAEAPPDERFVRWLESLAHHVAAIVDRRRSAEEVLRSARPFGRFQEAWP